MSDYSEANLERSEVSEGKEPYPTADFPWTMNPHENSKNPKRERPCSK